MARHWPDGRRHRHRRRRRLLRWRLLVLWRRLYTGCSSRFRSEGSPRCRGGGKPTLCRRRKRSEAGAGGCRSACGLRHSRFFRLRPGRVGIDRCAKSRGQARLRPPGLAMGLEQRVSAGRRPLRARSSWAQGVFRRTFILFSCCLSREKEGGPPLQRSSRVADERAEATLLLLAGARRPAVRVGTPLSHRRHGRLSARKR